MKYIIITIGILLIIIFTSIMHERDIYRQCKNQGNGGLATWTIKINCSPIN